MDKDMFFGEVVENTLFLVALINWQLETREERLDFKRELNDVLKRKPNVLPMPEPDPNAGKTFGEICPALMNLQKKAKPKSVKPKGQKASRN